MAEPSFLTEISLVSRRLKSEADRRLREHGVHAGQQFVLECLWREDGLAPGEIAQRIRVEAPTVTRAVQRMQATGLVVAGADEQDGRRTRVWLTSRGAALRDVLPEVLQQLEEDALRDLTPRERREFVRLLARVMTSRP
ncbi:MarR family winged helix-turn-helix transcriptional regulator [Actinoplanes sp. N902-109]|uniref:MarR family winged helix-turn-helix transcriptional regulator n=1 Tax=Actinoplanes sp. (strain N902-109) TaxID=649831 RepID=UPI0003294E4C|nr:MarR family transcriptional regulator [Actinoplanes sp. N902-109]AGL15723.1 transcriptional regulator, MarR family [Actinoplanes sp. N902-109]